MSDQPKIFLVVFGFLLGGVLTIVWYFAVNAESISYIISLPSWLIYVILSPLFLVPLVLGIKALRKFKTGLEIDEVRKKDLEALKFGLRLYFQNYGYFPQSSMGDTYSGRGIRIPIDWNLYQFPNHELMWKFIKHWPIHDPSFDVKNPNESKYYLYIVRDKGRHFSLYADLDNTKDKNAKDYNEIDNINPNLGLYNYKIGY